MSALRILAIIGLVFVVLITALLCLFFSMCAFGGSSIPGNVQGQYFVLDLVDIAVMVAALIGIVKLARGKR
ncbi:MAG TPA: hypothetical protein VHW45_01975 [Candidatus Sulfotelmatobacter sp.]|nr:hypothetical protein [Candidatus Sulfotelmatobacter sp.]